ncbi:MAG: SMP-30/gluconolactonase/LRE family protein [Acidobacteria bacterium]|nr:SMP-30/gluconolactonase/LRE family protein [Acidobacteriota bacterium]
MDQEKIRVAALALLAAACMSGQTLEKVAGLELTGASALSVGLTLPQGVARDAAGNVYFSQPLMGSVWKVTPDGVVQVAARGLSNPAAVAVDEAGNLFVATVVGVETVAAGSGEVRTLAKVEPKGELRSAAWLARMPDGRLVVADNEARMLKLVDAVSGAVSHLAGSGKSYIAGDNGPASQASLQSPAMVAVDGDGNVYYAEQFEPTVRQIDALTKTITNVKFGLPDEDIPGEAEMVSGLAADAVGNLYIAQIARGRVLRVNWKGQVEVFGKAGVPTALAAGAAGEVLVAEPLPPRIWKMRMEAELEAVVGNGLRAYNGDGLEAGQTQLAEPAQVAVAANGDAFVSSMLADRVLKIGPDGLVSTAGKFAWTRPQALLVDVNGDLVVSDYDNQMLYRVLGDGTVAPEREIPVRTAQIGARLEQPGTLVSDGTRMFLSSPNDHHVWVITADKVKVYAGTGEAGFAGDGEASAAAKLRNPSGLALDSTGNLYVADTKNHRVRKVEMATGLITTVWPVGEVDEASLPTGLAMGPDGRLYAADAGLNRVWRIDVGTGAAEVVVSEGLSRPCGVAFDRNGKLLVVDTGNARVVRVVTGE